MGKQRSGKTDPALWIFDIHKNDERRDLFEKMKEADRAEVLSFMPVMALLGSAAGEVQPSVFPRQHLIRRTREDRETRTAAKNVPHPAVKEADLAWTPMPFQGIFCKILHRDPKTGRITMLVRMEAGCGFPGHVHAGTEETLVVEGDIYTDDFALEKGDYHRAGPGSVHGDLLTKSGCVILVTKHVPDPMLLNL